MHGFVPISFTIVPKLNTNLWVVVDFGFGLCKQTEMQMISANNPTGDVDMNDGL